ncbi:16600_t:CDS:1, partial [Gigaspora margarita]
KEKDELKKQIKQSKQASINYKKIEKEFEKVKNKNVKLKDENEKLKDENKNRKKEFQTKGDDIKKILKIILQLSKNKLNIINDKSSVKKLEQLVRDYS